MRRLGGRTRKPAGALLLFWAAMAVGPSAVGNTIYTYTGNAFTTFNGIDSCPPECKITATFVLSQPLADNLSFEFVDPLSYSLTDGNIVLDETNSSVFNTLDFNVWTDSVGHLTGWFLNVAGNSGTPYQLDTTYQTEFPFIINTDETQTLSCSNSSCTDIGYASNYQDPATWSVSTATPEPSSVFLVVTVLLAFATNASLRSKLTRNPLHRLSAQIRRSHVFSVICRGTFSSPGKDLGDIAKRPAGLYE